MRKTLFLVSLFAIFAGSSGVAPQHAQAAITYEVPRAGAARALRLIDAAGNPLQGSFSLPRWELRGGGLFFTREWGGTRNIWRAFPDPQDTKRYPTWRALPVTHFQAPLFAANAVPIPRSRSILVVSNATKPDGEAQIVQVELPSGNVSALTASEGGAFDPAVSADGASLAYAATASGATSVYVQGMNGGAARRVARSARRPAWQDKETLLLESTTNPAVYRLPLADASRPLKLSAGEQVALSKEGSFLALSMKPGASTQMRLYLMAGDGSGLRAITAAADDARNPAISPNSESLCFDAPLPGSASERALWVMPLQRELVEPPSAAQANNTDSRRRIVENPSVQGNSRMVDSTRTRPAAPSARISGVNIGPGGALAIMGTISGEGVSATLEFGAGEKPARWTAVPVATPVPVGAPLYLWLPPVNARGSWTIRLNVSNEGGAAQSQYTLRLPVAQPKPDRSIPAPLPTTNNFPLPPGGPLPRAPLPELPVAPPLPSLPLPANSGAVQPRPTPRPTSRPTSRPIPQPAPQPERPPVTAPASGDSPAILPTFPNQPPVTRVVPRPAPAPAPRPSPVPRPNPITVRPSAPAPTPSPAPRPTVPTPRAGGDAATFNISGTLATMKANQKIKVTFWALNRGNREWGTGGAGGAGAVRLVARWVDFESGDRRKWNLQWMKQPVSPGQRTNWSFELAAPPSPGRYKLIYGLVRVPGENWEPPAWDAPQDSWPNEFAAIAFAVTVK